MPYEDSELDGYGWCPHVGTWLPEGECGDCVAEFDGDEYQDYLAACQAADCPEHGAATVVADSEPWPGMAGHGWESSYTLSCGCVVFEGAQ